MWLNTAVSPSSWTSRSVLVHDVVRAPEAPSVLLVGDGVDERLLSPRGQPQLQVVRSTVVELGSGDTLTFKGRERHTWG